MPRVGAKASDIDSCGLTLSELQELWLGAHPTSGSCFRSREELVAAWEAGRAVVMRLWARGGRRPAGFYEFEWEGPRPPYDVERSSLWRAGVLTEAERDELEAEWKVEFEKAQRPDLFHHTGTEILRGEPAQVAHYRWADIPRELVRRWTAARKRRPRAVRATEAPEKAPGAASGVRGEEESTGLRPEPNAAAGILE